MPELPEVEVYARYFAAHALGQTIARVNVRDDRVLGRIRRERLARALKGSFERVRRHGKHRITAGSISAEVGADVLGCWGAGVLGR